MADKDCESESIMSILDQMADSVQVDVIQDQDDYQEHPSSSSGLQFVEACSGACSSNEKDDKYWERRRKNNLAAKKSRDARKIRENQLRCRVTCLENANQVLRTKLEWEVRKNAELRQELKATREDNEELRQEKLL